MTTSTSRRARPGATRPGAWWCGTVGVSTVMAAVLALAVIVLAPTGADAQVRPSRTGGGRPGIDGQSYDFRVDFSSRGLDDSVRVVSTLTVYRTGRADTLRLDLGRGMRVEGALVNDRSVTFARDSASLRIPLPPGSLDTLRVAVRVIGRPTDGLIVRRDSAGTWTAFADHFPNRAREWLPTVDHPSDKATVEWTVRSPATHRVVANGERLEETPEPAQMGRPAMLLTRWRSVRPLYTAVMVIGVAPFADYELGRTACGLGELPGCVSQGVWISPDVRPSMPGAFARAGDIVALFSRQVGPFPYEKLLHVQSSTRYGGMENASVIFYADNIYRTGAMSEGLIAHETAHQWFGDAVTTKEWPHVWLSEGFATYFAALWTEYAHGDSAFVDEMRRMRQSVLDDKLAPEKPVVDESLSDLRYVLNGLVYQKAGFVLHMLRREVGDSAFYRGIRAYYAKYRHGNALTDDFVREMEGASGAKLGWFFDQWMHRPGWADVTVGWRWEASQRRLLVTASQGGTAAPYRLNLSMDLTDVRGKVHRMRVTIPAARVATIPVALPVEGAPRFIRFDPDVSLLGRLKTAP